MATAVRRLALVLLLAGLATGPLFSQESEGEKPAFGFKMDLNIGVQTFNEGKPPSAVAYQSLGLTPDISFGQLGIGLDITINFRFTGDGSSFEIRRDDWVASNFRDFLALYLAKINYIRWGEKGDPLFLKFGTIVDSTLGNGFILGNYSNALFLPQDRHFGLNADVDGRLFNFPMVGMESVIGNLAQLDLMGARVYVRPLLELGIPIVSNIEFGATVAMDTQPDLYYATAAKAAPIAVFGIDERLPLYYVKDVVSVVQIFDIASIQGKSIGAALGVVGRLISFITYGVQLRAIGANFIPVYFDATYDLFRAKKYDMVQSGGGVPGSVGWLASLGTSFLGDKIIFNLSIDGPFFTQATDPILQYPHLRGIIALADGVIPGISFDFSYDKKGIASFSARESSGLFNAENAAIQAKLNFKSGPAVISLVYKIVYDQTHTPDPWVVTSGLQSAIQLF